jgi:putative transposase
MRYIELNPVRAGMVASPARFPWSSHRANALGKADALVTPHALYEALGATPAARRARYRVEVMQAPGEDELRAIRDATQHEWVLGGSAFRQRVEEVTGRRAGRLPKGPRGHGVRSRRGAAT